MWTKILILAVLWLAIFRFAGRLIRYLAGPGGMARSPAAARDSAPNRAARARTPSGAGLWGGGLWGDAPLDGAPPDGAPLDGAPPDGAPLDGAPLDGAPRDGAPRGGAPRRVPGEVIDVEFEDLTPGSRR